MGATYSQLVVLGPSADQATDRVIAALGARPGFVTDPFDGTVGVFLDEAIVPDPAGVGDELAARLGATVLWFVVDDSDLLRGGVRAGEGRPVEFVIPERRHSIGWRGRGSSTERFAAEVAALGLADEQAVREVFRRRYSFEDDRHEDLLTVLSLPAWLRGVGHRYVMLDGPEIVPVRLTATGSG